MGKVTIKLDKGLVRAHSKCMRCAKKSNISCGFCVDCTEYFRQIFDSPNEPIDLLISNIIREKSLQGRKKTIHEYVKKKITQDANYQEQIQKLRSTIHTLHE